jgi:hypothetical protein
MDISCHYYPSDAIALHKQDFIGILVEFMDGIYVMVKKLLLVRCRDALVVKKV